MSRKLKKHDRVLVRKVEAGKPAGRVLGRVVAINHHSVLPYQVETLAEEPYNPEKSPSRNPDSYLREELIYCPKRKR